MKPGQKTNNYSINNYKQPTYFILLALEIFIKNKQTKTDNLAFLNNISSHIEILKTNFHILKLHFLAALNQRKCQHNKKLKV
jgi:hypothetical protein